MRVITLWIFIIGTAAIEPGCENCGCCVNGDCADTKIDGTLIDAFCTEGCTTGYRGDRCYIKCKDDCLTCQQSDFNTGKCTSCHAGKYVDTIGRCSGQCPIECKTCTSATICQECHPPYLNEGEITNCSLTCRRNCICLTPGECGSCKDGYYNTDDDCRGKCPDNCKTCSSPKNCHSCKDGSFNGRQESSLVEITDCSLACRDTCISCTFNDVCIICQLGYYGTFCQLQCSVGCLHGECDKVDGSCDCIDNFSGGQCTECILGRHGIQCEKQCPTTCPNDGQGVTCNKQDGVCLRCDVGFYGDICNKACNARCLNNRCNQDNGHCADGCIDDYEGPFCFPAQADNTAGIIGIGVGISSALIVITVVVLLSAACVVIRKWKRKLQLLTQASYVNTQLQGVSKPSQDNEQPQYGYDDFQTRHQAQDKEYDTI